MKRKYDLRKIMLRAWDLFRAAAGTGKKFGDCLRASWAAAKNAPVRIIVSVAPWFLRKNFSQGQRYGIETCDNAVIKAETEKAYKLGFDTDFGYVTSWFPKSVLRVEGTI